MDVGKQEPKTIESTNIVDALVPFAINFFEKLSEVALAVTPHFLSLAETFSNIDWEKVRQFGEALPDRAKLTMHRCAENGWFFSWHMGYSDLLQMLYEIEKLDDSEINDYFIKFYKENFPFLTSGINDAFPLRKNALNSAFRALEQSTEDGYYLSIPIFLSQADGILAEITSSPSPLQRGAEGAKKWAETISNDIEKASIHPIFHIDTYDLLKDGKQRRKVEQAGSTFTALNRHQILHGEVWDYGTEVKAFQAFSFLCFVTLQLSTVSARTNPVPQ
ncbi:hypothetical protein [Pseudomonas sp. URMO17WK12:I4]|uniref:hypothetical protein n=1 Tax=Pseudomonas sp. URMO17WK12:I4 TaxID=1283292 RepID=UPI0012DF2E95|nr:hypothetical protein [Pseudomonas sp. URMO17WK12:I4]